MAAGSGFYNLSRQLGGTFGIALLTLVVERRTALHRAHLVEHLTTANPLLQERLIALQTWLQQRAPGSGEGPAQALQLLSQQVDRQAALLAYGDVFRVVALLFLVVIPLVLLLGRPRPAASGAIP
jgi:DHA2 family multidrug resistance protein